MKHLERTKQELDNFVRNYKPSSDAIANGILIAQALHKTQVLERVQRELKEIEWDNAGYDCQAMVDHLFLLGNKEVTEDTKWVKSCN